MFGGQTCTKGICSLTLHEYSVHPGWEQQAGFLAISIDRLDEGVESFDVGLVWCVRINTNFIYLRLSERLVLV